MPTPTVEGAAMLELPTPGWWLLVPAVVLVAQLHGVRAARGPLPWLRAECTALAAGTAVLVVLLDGAVTATPGQAQHAVVAMAALATAGPLGALRARPGGRPAPWTAVGSGAGLALLGAVVPVGSVLVAAAWIVSHLAAATVLRRRALRLSGALSAPVLRATALGVAVLAVAGPGAAVLGGAVGTLVGVLLVVAVAGVRLATDVVALRGVGAGARTAGAVEDVLRGADDGTGSLEPAMALARTLLGATSLTMVADGDVLASTAPAEEHWRLVAVAGLHEPGDPPVPLDDGRWLDVVHTARCRLLVEISETVDVHGGAERALATCVVERLGSVLDREDARRRERAATAAMRTAETMREDFLSTLSHELRTPLTSIRGFSQVLASSARSMAPEQLDDLARRLVRSAQDLEAMVAGLLELTEARGRSQPQRVGSYDLADIVERAVARTGTDLALHRCTVDVASVLVHTDGAAIIDALVALLDNVAKFTPPGTSVEVLGWVADGTAVVTVADDGPGLPEELGALVLEPFVRGGDVLTRPTRGVGIGLTVARELCRQLGGTLNVGRPATGAVLRLVVPAVHPLADVADMATGHTPRQARTRLAVPAAVRGSG